ncbi:MAG: radical SAM protein [Burkholderiales bacterium]|nr:radical SAM protein [Burkholderiales bacterium]
MSIVNSPVAYDFHGDIPFSTPFSEIKPEDISLYIDLDTNVGKDTCGQNCGHCWFVNYEKVFEKSFGLEEGRAITDALRKEGYTVYPSYVDSFAGNGDFMRTHGAAHSREFRQTEQKSVTDTMKLGDAWTSGRPLNGDNHEELLDLAVANGYGTISITFHGVLDAGGKLLPRKTYPIDGVFHGEECITVVNRINAYNRARSGSQQALRVNIGITIGKHNHTREHLLRYVELFNDLGVSTVRFNNFLDHGGRHPELELDRVEIEAFYRDARWIHDNVGLHFQLALSEDFGTFGVKVMGFPSSVGWCRAGQQLFTIIPSERTGVACLDREGVQKVADVVGCVNTFAPHLGMIVKTCDPATGRDDYKIEFDAAAIAAFTQKRISGVYKNGCFAREILAESPPELTRQAKKALEHRKTIPLMSVEPSTR